MANPPHSKIRGHDKAILGRDLKPSDKECDEDFERAKRLQVEKVSHVKRCCTSIKLRFCLIVIFFIFISVALVTVTGVFQIMAVYQKMNVVEMKHFVGDAVSGVQKASNVLIERGENAAMNIGNPFLKNASLMNDFELAEQALAKNIYETMHDTVEGAGLFDFFQMPFHLVMLWDKDWNERLVYYRPCVNKSDRSRCVLVPEKNVFVDYANRNYSMAHKDEVPTFFKSIKDMKPSKCDENGVCLGIAIIPNEEGGSMMYYLNTIKNGTRRPNIISGWHMLTAYNMLLLTEVQANRTGLSVSGFSSIERGIDGEIMHEFQVKSQRGQVYNPHDSVYDAKTLKWVINQNTGIVTMSQEYYSRPKQGFRRTGRDYRDESYENHFNDSLVKSFVYFAYEGFDLANASLNSNQTYLIRLDYHDPVCGSYLVVGQWVVVAMDFVWIFTLVGVGIYFNHVFLHPLKRMRKMRADLIKTSLAGLDDDGVLAKKLFGDMIDDSALIEANGDEITVMLTLQDRIDAFYTSLIKARESDFAHVRANLRKEIYATTIMNYFMRQDDANIHAFLPGLLDSKEVARRFHNVFDDINPGKSEIVKDLTNARRAFRSLKAILNNDISTEFFKAYCFQRGRSTLNSLFFLMDVSWLHQVESSARSEADDFLSKLFSEPINNQGPHSPITSSSSLLSPLSPPSSSDGLFSPTNAASFDLAASIPEQERPHHSHFAKTKEPEPVKTEEKADADKGRKKKLFVIIDKKNSVEPAPFSPKPNGVDFLTKNGKSIAHFIHSSYFGHKSLAQLDLKHSALLGCSRIPDYVTLRDKKDIVFSPVMYNNLVTAVSKKFTSEVVPHFMNSTHFQVMVYCLLLTDYFEKTSDTIVHKTEEEITSEEESLKKKSNALVNSLWLACYSPQKNHKGDDNDNDDSSSSDDDDENNEATLETEASKKDM